ncbi:MAG: TIGR01458 family HAD-type hydrolase [Cyanobacteria bacterium Co-bin8]|nr:TIGR01458 family HAD-type hydrolase [Cyanobacteria bacterium Co-bin8]
MTSARAPINGLLLDLNGVFYVSHRTLKGAVSTVERLKESGIPHRFATNNTTESVADLSRHLKAIGLPIEPESIISAPYAAVLYLRQKGNPTLFPLLSKETRQDFAEFNVSETAADVVVLGDMGDEWSYQALNRAFKLILKGAELIALHKAKYWQWEAGLQLDIGAFATALEFATGQQATVIGKPNAAFFNLALKDLGLPPEQVAMVGDDIEDDIGGAQALGIQGILVKSGKYREPLVQKSAVVPDMVVDSLDDMLNLIGL